MRRRVAPLTPPALLCCLLALLWSPAPALAHRLVIECQVLPDNQVRVEAWYNAPNNPHPARQASVQVFDADGASVTEGQLDGEGVFTFTYDRPRALRVVVTQTGHRDELVIPAERLGGATATREPGHDMPAITSGPTPSVREWIRDVLTGVGFLLALAAFVLSIRNARRLRERG